MIRRVTFNYEQTIFRNNYHLASTYTAAKLSRESITNFLFEWY